MSNNPEVFNGNNPEQLRGAQEAAEAQAEALKDKLEQAGEQSPEARAEAEEKARAEANKEALLSKERGGAETKAGGEPTATVVRRVTKAQKQIRYKQTLRTTQAQMSAPARVFSKVIHNPVVEKVSDSVGNTIARPNAILAGSTTALIIVVGTYMVAKQYGYPLSGFETIGAFAIGWLIGIILDYVRILVKGDPSK